MAQAQAHLEQQALLTVQGFCLLEAVLVALGVQLVELGQELLGRAEAAVARERVVVYLAAVVLAGMRVMVELVAVAQAVPVLAEVVVVVVVVYLIMVAAVEVLVSWAKGLMAQEVEATQEVGAVVGAQPVVLREVPMEEAGGFMVAAADNKIQLVPLVQYALFGPEAAELPVHSHQQILVICNETFYSN